MYAIGTLPAFRCKNCGHLEGALHAGENLLPHACSVCNGGVVHSPTAQRIAAELAKPECTPERRKQLAAELVGSISAAEPKLLNPDNWEVLADCTPARLKELGLAPDGVCKHSPEKITTPNLTQAITREVADALGLKKA